MAKINNNIKIGDKVSFWQTVLGKKVIRTGIFRGYAAYNHKAIIETGYGETAYKHYIKEDKLIILKENLPELPFEG